ncbi:MAG: transglutaminase-like domain-containing protein [Methanomassiliicoccales archaeon]|jgi:transglutaminase-like putative cysteine protease
MRNGTKVAVITSIAILLAVVLLVGAVSQGWIHFNINPITDNDHSQALTDGNYTITYSWLYLGKEWTLKDNVSAVTYNDYRDRPKTYDYASYVTKNDPLVVEIADQLKDLAGNESYNTAQFVLSFVQNVPYGTDENTTGFANYPRYPVETLVDGVGDCKDHSTLYVSLMESQAVNASMVLFLLTPRTGDVGHMAAGIYLTGHSGTYFEYDGRDYFYCETTAPGWLIGVMPQQVRGYSVQVLSA